MQFAVSAIMAGMDAPVMPLDGRERRKLTTRRALRSAALDLALERGLFDVPVEAIAARAGVSTRTFFNYFETKEDAVLLGLPGFSDEELARLAQRRGVEGVWSDLVELLVTDAERVEQTVVDLPRLLQLHLRTPALLTRQVARFVTFEAKLTDAVATRIGPGPAARTRAELIAGAATVAGRVGLHRWGLDDRRRPIRFHVEAAYALVPVTFAGL
jgi:AcrR family transcriptional regulator